MFRRTLTAAVCLLAAAALARGQEGSLRFEKMVPFQRDQVIPLGARVGPVRVANVRFGLGSAGGVKGAILSRVHGGDSDVTSIVRASFDTENPKAEEWNVTYTLELLDTNGKLIDRATRTGSFEGEASTFELEHSTLSYVVPLIARVRVRLEASLD
ncbi:MAG TPA: hypothetical protein VGV61_01300 [Thermoanaerobaculia bacterium]|jgi:hypothetical protein|nr:hypothetical protein [Thermoanaerobaculia bacterium]